MKFGVLDSGVGGISVLIELKKLRPYHDYYYLGDNNNAPYGDKTKGELINLTDKNIAIFKRLKINNIIVACNTLSTTLRNYLKKTYKDIKFYFVYPKLTTILLKNKICYVLCTKKTAFNLKKYKIIRENQRGLKIFPCPGLVEIIEKKYFKIKLEEIKRFLPPKEPDVLYLGCTHYPLVTTFIKKVYKSAKIYDGISPLIKKINKVNTKKTGKIFFLGECKGKNYLFYVKIKKKLQKVEKILL